MNNSILKSTAQGFVDSNGVLNLQNSVLVAMQDPDVLNNQTFLVALEQLDSGTKDNVMLNGVNIQGIVSEENENPLGSSENPIEIIQDGETLVSTQNLSKNHLQLIADALQDESNKISTETANNTNFVYRIVYPEELNLKPIFKKKEKRGRPRKRPVPTKEEESVAEKKEKPLKNARTRSGRITRPPRHIEKVFRKIETKEYDENEEDIRTTEFTPLTTDHTARVEQKPELLKPLDFHQKRRNISARYRCPKCQKAYLGRSRMLKHFQDNPDHGPIPEHCKDNNFETWNFLVDITQKCSLTERGKKFCEELTNLLHNAKILAKVLFKATNDTKHSVTVDRVLGNALDLKPGDYKFNDHELHKDVTFLTLLENSKFFEDTYLNTNSYTENENNSDSKKDITEKRSMTTDNSCVNQIISNNSNISMNTLSNKEDENTSNSGNQITTENPFEFNHNNHKTNDCQSKIANECQNKIPEENNKPHDIDNSLSLHNELLEESSLLNLPNLRNGVDDLILSGVNNGHINLLDNSTSSDEVINVDQFVNERFKKITEPEIDLHNTSMNLDLPALDLFQFNDS